MKKPPKPVQQPAKSLQWAIYQIRSKAVLLGTVEAPDEPTAIRKAIEEWQIAWPFQNRLMAQQK